jgi:hypothetical protein
MSAREATEIEEYVSSQEFMNWVPSPIIGRKCDTTKVNSKMHGQLDSQMGVSDAWIDLSLKKHHMITFFSLPPSNTLTNHI